MLGAVGYKTKKAIKDAMAQGKKLNYIETSLHGTEYQQPGKNVMVGPDAYNNRAWYATVTVDANGYITKVQ